MEEFGIDTRTGVPGLRKPLLEYDDAGFLKRVSVSYSMISSFFYDQEMKDYCPKKVYHVNLLRDVKGIKKRVFDEGNYFEYLVIGATADGVIPNIERLKNGKKSISQTRIEEQARFARLALKRMKITPTSENTQVYIEQPYIPKDRMLKQYDVLLTGTLDIYDKFMLKGKKMPKSVIDIKLTKDRFGLYTYNPWGDMEKVDKTQAYLYSYLTKSPFYYWVWDYKPQDRGSRLIPVITIDAPHLWKKKDTPEYNLAVSRKRELFNSIELTLQRILFHENIGWEIEYPSTNNCSNCRLNPKYGGNCKAREEGY